MNPLQRLRDLIAAAGKKCSSRLDLWQLKNSCLDHIDGVAICDLTITQRSKDDFLDLTRQAMALIKSLDARRYRRVCRCLHYIANTALISRGQFGRTWKVCRVDYIKYFTSAHSQRNVRDYAGVLIHEATHGLLFEKGIPYDKETRERVERLCHLESYRFALHFEPGYADLYPGPYNPKGHKWHWESSRQTRRSAWRQRFWQAYRAYKSSNPKSARDYNERGLTYASKGEYDKAIADYNDALRLDPKFVSAYSNRGSAFRRKRDFERAIADCDQAIRLDPALVASYNNRGLVYGDKGEHDRAISDYDAALRLDPKFPLAYYNRGCAYMQKRDYDKAIADYDHAIRLNPKDARSYNNRGAVYMWTQGYDKAIADYDHAIQLNPRDATAYKNLAWLLATCPQAGFRDGKKAVEHATKAYALSEWKDRNAVKTLAAACAEAGDFDNAVKWQSQYFETPNLDLSAAVEARSRLALYQAHQPFHAELPNKGAPDMDTPLPK